MKIGTIYKTVNWLFMPLSEPNLDGIAIFMRVNIQACQYEVGRVILDEYSKVSNTNKANAFMDSRVDFLGIRVTEEFKKKAYPTYVASNINELNTGDRFQEAGKSIYTILGFFEREVIEDVTSAKRTMIHRDFPYALDPQPLIDYVKMALNSRNGIESIIETSDAALPPTASAFGAMKALFFSNTKLAYWSPDAARPSSVVYLKQQESYPVIDYQTTPFANKQLTDEEYAEYRALLGEEYPDEFIDIIDQLNWAKISELRKEIPEILTPIKELLNQMYIQFLIEQPIGVKKKAPAVVTPPPTVGVPLKTFKWLDDDWIQINEVAYNAFQKAYGALASGKILIRSLEAVVPASKGSTEIELRKFTAVAFDEVGYSSDKLLELRNGLIDLENDPAAEYMKINYPAYFEGWDVSIAAENRFLFDYDKFIDVAVLLAVPTVKSTPAVVPPPSQEFKWITSPWKDLLTEDEMKSLVDAGLWYKGGFAKYASFECVYKNEGRKSFAMYSFGHAYLGGSYNALTEALYKYMVANIDRDYIWVTYPQVLDATATAITGSSVSVNFVDTFIIAFDDVGLFKDLLDAAVTAPTTAPLTDFKWADDDWLPFYSTEQIQEIIKAGLRRLIGITAMRSFTAKYKAEGTKRFYAIVLQGVPTSSAYGKMVANLKEIQGRMDIGYISQYYKEAYIEIDALLAGYKHDADWFVIADIHIESAFDAINEYFMSYRATYPAPQKQTAKKKPAKKAEPKPVAEELDDLLNLDFDDI
jgi:hypothetical protein